MAALQRDLEQVVEATMEVARIPALAIAVLEAGQPVLQRAFGFRDIERGLPATSASQFAICSITKSFTATGLAMLVEEGRLDWDRPIREMMPEFRLQDPLASKEITLRDALAHRSGLPRHDWVWIPGDRSEDEMLAALGELAPSREFRSAYQYQNLMYMVAGMLAGRVAGMSWEDFTRQRLLRPLGMAQSSFSIDELRQSSDFAEPYTIRDGDLCRLPMYPIRTAPAGAINASIDDMSRYLRFHLDLGVSDGRQLLAESQVRLLQSPQMFVRAAEYPELGDAYYGFGFETVQFRGEKLVRHGGSWVGWGSLLAMLPERGIGLVILTNRYFSPPLDFLAYAILDRLCGASGTDWPARCRAKIEQESARRRELQASRRSAPARDGAPAHPLADYVGRFEHPAYGRVSIDRVGDRLRWRGLGLDTELGHRSADAFAFPDGPDDDTDDYVALHAVSLTFAAGPSGDIDRFAIPLEPAVPDAVFRRRA
jgi:CubicO group peptidase (beta-lactamase class C family)